jgi:hypothetical protein
LGWENQSKTRLQVEKNRQNLSSGAPAAKLLKASAEMPTDFPVTSNRQFKTAMKKTSPG